MVSVGRREYFFKKKRWLFFLIAFPEKSTFLQYLYNCENNDT